MCCGQIDVEGLGRDRDQIWAEAYQLFKQGEPWWLETPELNSLAGDEQEQRYEEGIWDNTILEFVEDPRPRADQSSGVGTSNLPWGGSKPGKVTIIDVLVHGIGKNMDRLTQMDRNQVARCLTHHGWKTEQERHGPNRGKRFYVRRRL